MEKSVVDLFAAVTQIKPKYFKSIGTRKDRTTYPQSIEQSFSAELYHRFKTIMELPANLDFYKDLILNFDITKASIHSRPDLVLHEGQESRGDQNLFIEVKTDSGADLSNDFHKLFLAIHDDLEFRGAVLIVVNRKFSETLKKLNSYDLFKDLPDDDKKKIFIINIESVTKIKNDYNICNLYYLKQIGDE